MKNLVYFDLETQKSADEVGGWSNSAAMLLSIGVTYSTTRGTYQIYDEKHVQDLITELQRADVVIGFNHVNFDYTVLQKYSIFDLRETPSLDILLELQKVVGRRLSLDAVAQATLGFQKTAEGLQAIQWYRQGKMLEIAEYCCYDVKLTRLLHEYGVANKKLYYTERTGKKVAVPVNW